MKRLKRKLDTEEVLDIGMFEEFEKVVLNNGTLYRLYVPGGWLVKIYGYRECSICFYPDPNHKWDGEYFRYKQEPEDLRDDWPHAKVGLREAARTRKMLFLHQLSQLYNNTSNSYYYHTLNPQEPISNSTRG